MTKARAADRAGDQTAWTGAKGSGSGGRMVETLWLRGMPVSVSAAVGFIALSGA
jgi:hypothetical protein